MRKISSVITAIGNIKINKELKEKNINVQCNDIQYKEGVIEFLEYNKNIDFIIIEDTLPGDIKTEELVNKIKKINNKIKIILLSKNKEIKIQVYKIYEKIETEEIIKIINEKNNKVKINKSKKIKINNKSENKINNKSEIKINNKSKNKIENKSNNKSENKIENKINNIYNKKTIPINNFFKEESHEGKILTILGPNGIGKSIFSITFANNIKNQKIIIIDFDVLNNSLHTLLGVKEYSKKIQKNMKNNNLNQEDMNIFDFIIKTKYNVDLISGINLIFDSKYQINPTKIKSLINKIKKEYDLIIIDTSSECFLDYTRELIEMANQSIFISGANILEIKKAQKLLEIYTKEWGIQEDTFNIVFNKCTDKSVDDEVLKNIFKRYIILGKIKLNDYYDLAINKNSNKIKEIQQDLDKIRKQILDRKENKSGARK